MAKGIQAFPFGAISAYFQRLCHVSFKECTFKNILSLKRKLTMETRPFEDIFSIENGDFQYHVSFRGCTFPETNSEFLPLKIGVWKIKFPFWDRAYGGYICVREDILEAC